MTGVFYPAKLVPVPGTRHKAIRNCDRDIEMKIENRVPVARGHQLRHAWCGVPTGTCANLELESIPGKRVLLPIGHK